MMRFWILSLLLPPTLAISGKNIDPSRIQVFPDDHKIAGVFQVSYKNRLNQLVYSFNASEARDACQSLGSTIASKDEVDEAHRQGLETCRFGWIDEHYVVVPRVEASETCGRNKTGVITWRVLVVKAFDVFCFDESAVKQQLEDTTTDAPLTTPEQQESPHPSLPGETTSTSTSLPPAITHLARSTHSALPTSQSPSSPLSLGIPPSTSIHPFPDSSDEGEAEPPQTMNSAQSSIGVVPKALLITSTFVLLLTAMAILWYFKMYKSLFPCWDVEQQKEYIETEEWPHTCVKKDMREAQTEAEEEDVSKETANNLSVNTSSETDSATEEP